ncbi:MarR family winged helix-turn-helix transcriptional regulator [Streptomyces sp. AM6-12]|uniref:MarR family winged helix-turn-helix transcriptional regulator n=1 Tax=Streptomyces sp. AM6-12 TaxID=3345149 RepID=UPI0037BD11D8
MEQSRQLAEDLRAAVGHLVRSTKHNSATMPAAEAAILGLLYRDGPQTIAELAQARGVRHQSAARTVKELTQAGLIATRPHPTDGRKLLVHVTPAGRAALEQDRHARADVLADAIDKALTACERDQLRRGVELLVRLGTQMRS